MNIFSVIRSATHRTEPFHSIFLGEALKESLSDDRSLFDQFWNLSVGADPDWPRPHRPIVKSEDVIGSMRVDLTIVDCEAKRCLGIEVKTHDASARKGQLSDYQRGLKKKYTGYEVRMVYLTPLNRARSEEQAGSLRTVAEFDAFTPDHPEAKHLSWLDVAEIQWPGGGENWRQHQEYVKEVICKPRFQNLRGLDEFFGSERVEDFLAALPIPADSQGEFIIDLGQVANPEALADAFRVLILSPAARTDRERPNRFDPRLRDAFLDSDEGHVHAAIFALAEKYPWTWLRGRKNYGLRVDHPGHGGGVSICTSDGPSRLRIGRAR